MDNLILSQSSEYLVKCHYCGYQETPPNQCPNCESEHIRQVGTGTQKVEELLQQEFEDARIIRMDVDTTSKKGAHEKLLTEFEKGNGDILISLSFYDTLMKYHSLGIAVHIHNPDIT